MSVNLGGGGGRGGAKGMILINPSGWRGELREKFPSSK